MKKLLFIIVFGFSLNIFSQGTAPKGEAPILSNFRIENNEPSRVYFDSSKGIAGSKKKGFVISGKNISKLNINSGQTTGHYLTVSSPFTFWDNNTIKLENGSGTIYDFTLTYIENNINEPTTSINRYVSVLGGGLHNGTNEANAWTLTEGMRNAVAGQTVWIKKGTYSSSTGWGVSNSGTPTNPIKFKGYDTTIGDLDNDYIVDYFDYGTSPRTALAYVDPTKFPVLDGINTIDNAKGLSLNDRSNIIIKNIQSKEFEFCFFTSDNVNNHYENCTGAQAQTNGKGVGFKSGIEYTQRIRYYKCLSFDNNMDNIWINGDHGLVRECKTYSGESDGRDTDYQIVHLSGNNTILTGNYVQSFLKTGSIGHGIGVKQLNYDTSITANEHVLISNNEVRLDDGEALFFAHQGVTKSVIKNNHVESETGYSNLRGLQARDGAYGNIYEYNTIIGASDAINMYSGVENEPAGSGNLVSDNIFRNNTFKNIYRVVNLGDDTGNNYTLRDNKIYNNTFYNITGFMFVQNGTSAPFVGNEFKNNIVYGDGNVTLYSGNTSATSFDQQYNDYYNTGQSTPSGTGNKSINPNFVDLKDFVPANTGLNKGTPLNGVELDKNKSQRSSSTPTMGAVEIQDTTTGFVEANAGEDQNICQGESVTLTASGGLTYIWSTGETTASITVSPTATKSYTVKVKDGNMTDEDEVLVTVNIVTADAGADVTINKGESTTLTASGGDTYLWNTGETTESINVSPGVTENYEVRVSKNGCEAIDTIEVTVVIPEPIITADAGEDQTICNGESVSLIASGGTTYEWSTGETTASIEVSPTATKTYTVTAKDGSLTGQDNITVTVTTVTADAGYDQKIDEGEIATLTASGGDTYLWSTGETTKSLSISPNTTTIYEVIVIANGCEDTDTVKVIVNPTSSTVEADAGEDVTIYKGESIVLTASKGTLYNWSNGETTRSIAVSPDATQTYSVIITEGNISDNDEVVVTVIEVVADAGKDVIIVEGEIITLTATGGDTYLWSTGETTRAIDVSPEKTINYTVTVYINEINDSDSVQVTVTQKMNPPEAFAGNDVTICAGESVTLSASGGQSYIWSTGAINKNIIVSPKTTTTYTLNATSGGFTDADTVIITVENCNNLSFENVLESKLIVYPVPSTGIINVNLSNTHSDFNLVLINLNGIVVYSGKMDAGSGINKQIDLSNLVKGYYVIRLFNANENLIKKILLI